MNHRRFFLSQPPEGNEATLSGEEAHHLIHVLRAKAGESIELINGSGAVWRGEIAEVRHDSVEIANLTLLPQDQAPLPNIILIQSLCKTEKLEWIFQKTTELGVAEIFLLNASRSVLRIPRDKTQNKLERWSKIILAAAKQSRRRTIPRLHAPADCMEICQSLQADLKLILSEDEKEVSLKQRLTRARCGSVAFSIGPEGGWTPQEQETFGRHHFESVTLGSNILRAETAAIVVAAILRYELGNSQLYPRPSLGAKGGD